MSGLPKIVDGYTSYGFIQGPVKELTDQRREEENDLLCWGDLYTQFFSFVGDIVFFYFVNQGLQSLLQ